MLDLVAVSSGGGTSLTTIGTILAGGDGQTVAGVPRNTNPAPTLVGWGGISTAADTILELQLLSNDDLDPTNQRDWSPGASNALGTKHFWDNMQYVSNVRTLKMSQNTGANNNIGYYLDLYPGGNVTQLTKYGAAKANWMQTTTYGAALTAITWKEQALAPGQPMPQGRYAIHGAIVGALGAAFVGLLAFKHNDFGAYTPGFPVLDGSNSAVARLNVLNDELFLNDGYQFDILSRVLNQPCNPIFTAGPQGTGLSFRMASITADTPKVTILCTKVG